MTDVRRLDVLPSKQNPVVAFLGVSENAKRASFLVSSDVTDTDGEDTCLKSKTGACELVTMKTGDSRDFIHGGRAERFPAEAEGDRAAREAARGQGVRVVRLA